MSGNRAMEEEEHAVTKQESEKLPAEVAELFDLKENMVGVEPRLPQIGIIHQGQMFEMPDHSKVESFKGIILDVNRINSYWKEGFDETGGGNPPDCMSLDGVTPSEMSEDIQSKTCVLCDKNQYETADKGTGKACKNAKRIHLMLDGCLMPYRLTIPPTNLKAIDTYISILTSEGIPYQLAVTQFRLVADKNAQGVEFSVIDLEKSSVITDIEQGKEIRKTRDSWLGVMRGQIIDSKEV